MVRLGVIKSTSDKKIVKKKGKQSTISTEDSEEEEEVRRVGTSKMKSKASVKNVSKFKTKQKDAEEHQEYEENKSGKSKRRKIEVDENAAEEEEEELPAPGSNLLEFAAQKAMSMLTQLCDAFNVKWSGANIQPLNAVWAKLASAFMRRIHPEFRCTFSSFESFNCQIGRFIAAMVYFKCELAPKFLPGGVYIWRHDWIDRKGNVRPKCLHGVEMVIKPRTVELSAVSEAGKRAVGEQGATIEKNRFGKSVVILRFDKNIVCFKDSNHGGFPNPHASGSCAMVFSDSDKAISAIKHDIEWTKAIYPNVPSQKVEERILIVGNCSCNYASESCIQGRQLCKMVPYKMNGTDDISDEVAASRPDMEAHKVYGHTMVFMCCNPNNSRPGPNQPPKMDRTCAWKLSAIDLRFSYIFANEVFNHVFGSTVNPKLTEFKWINGYAFKTDVIQPAIVQHSTELF